MEFPSEIKQDICVNPLFQFLLIIISCISLTTIFYYPLAIFRPGEGFPQLVSISPKNNFFEYNPPIINVGLYINQFEEFNILTGKVIFSGMIWFEYDPTLVPLKTFENIIIDGGTFVHKSQPITHYDQTGIMILRYDVTIALNQHFIYKRFPFDDHRLMFSIAHEYLGPQDIILQASNRDIVIAPTAEESGWELVGTRVRDGFLVTPLRHLDDHIKIERSAVSYYLNYSRSSAKYGFTIFLPMFFILFLTLFSFSLNPERFFATIIGISTGGITGMIAYRFVIESLSPKVSYFMISDYFFLIIFALIFCILLLNVIFTRCNEFRNKIILVIIHVLLLLSTLYIVLGNL